MHLTMLFVWLFLTMHLTMHLTRYLFDCSWLCTWLCSPSMGIKLLCCLSIGSHSLSCFTCEPHSLRIDRLIACHWSASSKRRDGHLLTNRIQKIVMRSAYIVLVTFMEILGSINVTLRWGWSICPARHLPGQRLPWRRCGISAAGAC